MRYEEAKILMNNIYFKSSYMKICDDVMERKGLEYNQWVLHEINGDFGLKDKENRWCWRNTINTHPYCFLELYNFSVDLGMNELDFSNSGQWLNNIKKLWIFLETNWELIFTDNIETKYYYKLLLRTNKSWSIGQITTIAFLYVFREIFESYEFKKINFSLERGDPDDFGGIDVRIFTKKGKEFTIQIKSGNFKEGTDSFSLTSSVNDLRSPATHYCYVDIQNNETRVVLFKNEKEKINRTDETYFFPKELLENKVIIKNMPIPQILYQILMYCADNKIVFDLNNKPEETNNITWVSEPEKIVTVTISDFKDENLEKLLIDKFKELKETFQ